jgi:hypothetical protein
MYAYVLVGALTELGLLDGVGLGCGPFLGASG